MSSPNLKFPVSRALRTVLTAISVTTLSLLAVTVRAETPPASVVVSLQGLDLTRDNEARIALERLQAAARSVCRESSKDLLVSRREGLCYQQTLQHAVEATGIVSLSRLLQEDERQRLVRGNARAAYHG